MKDEVKLVGGGFIKKQYYAGRVIGEHLFDKKSGIERTTEQWPVSAGVKKGPYSNLHPSEILSGKEVSGRQVRYYDSGTLSLTEDVREDGSLAFKRINLAEKNEEPKEISELYDEKGSLRYRSFYIGLGKDKRVVNVAYDEKRREIGREFYLGGKLIKPEERESLFWTFEDEQSLLKEAASKERLIKKALSEVQEKPKTNLLGMLKRLLPKTKVKKVLEAGVKAGSVHANSKNGQSR